MIKRTVVLALFLPLVSGCATPERGALSIDDVRPNLPDHCYVSHDRAQEGREWWCKYRAPKDASKIDT
jgi:hypothetical protein